MLEAISRDGFSLDLAVLVLAVAELRREFEVVLKAFRQHGSMLELAAMELPSDRDVVLVAGRQHGSVLELAATELHSN